MHKVTRILILALLLLGGVFQCKTTVPSNRELLVKDMQYQRYTTGMNGYRGIIFKIYLADSVPQSSLGALTINDTVLDYAILYHAKSTEIEANVFYESTGMDKPQEAALYFDENYTAELQVNNKSKKLHAFKTIPQDEIP